MDSYLENAFNIIKQEKEDKAKIDLVRGVEEINRLKRENKYFDNAISSDLYNKVNEVVDDLTDNYDDVNIDNQIENSNLNEHERARKAGMILKKKLVENLIQIREDSINMCKIKFFYYLVLIFFYILMYVNLKVYNNIFFSKTKFYF